MQIILTPAALDDIENIVAYIAKDNKQAARKLHDNIKAKVYGLVDFPLAHKEGRIQGTREMVVHPHYVVVYSVLKTKIKILRVLHTSLQWP